MYNAISKISKFLPLFAPAGEGSMGGGGTPTNGTGDDSNAKGDNNDSSAGSGDDDDQLDGDDDESSPETLAKLLMDDDDDDDSEFDFGVGDDDDDDDDQPTPEQKAKGEELGREIKSQIDALVIKESDIPEDMDWSDRKQVSGFLSKHNDKMAKTIVHTIPKILAHAITAIVPKLNKHIEKTVGGKSKQSEAATHFESLGFKGEDRKVAKTFYERGLAKKMKPAQAAAATRQAMKTLGKTGRSSNNRDSGGSLKIGKDAIDSLFK